MSAEKVGRTPGPWEACRDDEREEYSIGKSLARVGIRLIATVQFGFDEPAESEQHANAHLIASAPDLLALAKRYARECGTCEGRGFCIEPIDHEEIDCNDCADIRAVIEKAEGGA